MIPLPIYRMVSIGGDTQFTANLEYRIPIVNQVTFAFFTDFGMDFDVQPGQLRQSVGRQFADQRAAVRMPDDCERSLLRRQLGQVPL